MSTYKQFIFEEYHFETATKLLTLNYSIDSKLQFTETYCFDFDFTAYNSDQLDRACQHLFFMAGVSYYKTFLPPEVIIKSGQLDPASAQFFNNTYQRGLGELFYINQLDPHTSVTFPSNTDRLATIDAQNTSSGLLVAIGGGKDSLVSVELLRNSSNDVATWSLSHREQLAPLIERIGLPHYWVERQWDPALLALKDDPGAYNGHVPISAIFACTGTIVAILSGRRDVVVSNESSTSEPMLHYRGAAINHQYSKSLEFEQDYQTLLTQNFGQQVRYFSFLRPLSEVRIAELFASLGFATYHDVFSSCNKAFVYSSNHIFWDGTCPKCAFVFLAFTPFVDRAKLEQLFSGKNLLVDSALEPIYKQLLGIEGDRPLECVGDIKESRVAMQMAQRQYPELSTYHFGLPDSYNYHHFSQHSMPEEYYDILRSNVTQD